MLQPRVILIIWILAAIIFAIQGLITLRYNNYLIFKYCFPHLIHQLPLYIHYPTEYGDVSHYGPVFSILIAPFYLLPDWIGLPAWDIINAMVLWWAIMSLPLNKQTKSFLGWFALPVLIASTLSEQFNPIAGAFIIFSFVLIRKERQGWSAFFIALGTFIKLYGIVGLAFFFFTKKKKQFVVFLLLWFIVLFILPVPFSSMHYILQSYQEWFRALVDKNALNISLFTTQDVSIMGFTRRLLLNPYIPDLPFLIAAVILFIPVYIHKDRFFHLHFQLAVLAAVLIAPVIFSTSSEDVTYIIAVTGAGIWFLMSANGWYRNIVLALLLFVMLVPLWTILPENVLNHYPAIHSLKAVPYTLIWLYILFGIHREERRESKAVGNRKNALTNVFKEVH
ncbi:MAG: glycosyltransferase family 87 protein [Chitinophagaceae bacterium]